MLQKIQRYALQNGRLIEAARARISPLGEGFMYGRGLFETIKVLGGRPVFLPDHVERLCRSAAALALPLKATAAELSKRSDRLISANGLSDGSLKIVVFQDTDGPGELILTRKGLYAPELYARGYRLTAVPDGRPSGSVAEFKTLNYLGNSVARRRALAAGFDEALFIDSAGAVLECAGSNVFAVEGGRVLTPPLGGGILPGIARGNVLRLLGGRRVRECPLPLARLLGAAEVFVTNALLGVMPVSRIDGRIYDVSRNPVTQALREAYGAAEAEAASQRRTRPARKSIAGG
jgi:branched-subunit amino acid aminotransferase/4-amino-4-deoxychorismate lyase